jgi:hypothetical protein
LPVLRSRLAKEGNGPLQGDLEAAIQRLEEFTLGGISGFLRGCNARERRRLAEAIGELEGGIQIRLVGKVLTIESASVRGLLVELIRAEETFLSDLESCFGGAGESSTFDLVPLLTRAMDPAIPEDHPVVSLLAAAGQSPSDPLLEAGRPAYDAALEILLDPNLIQKDSRVEITLKVRKLARLLGVFAKDPAARNRTLDAILGEDSRRAETALEVLDGSGVRPIHRPGLLRLCKAARPRLT